MSSPRNQNAFAWPKSKSSYQKLSLVLIWFGLLCLTAVGLFISYRTKKRQSIAFSQLPTLEEKLSEFSLPTRLIIPKVKIDLPVLAAKASEDVWEVNEKGTSYLLGSGAPGQEGNVIIYGHNKNSLLGPIRWLEKGDEIKIINTKNEEFIYQAVETKTVSPESIEVLSPTDDTTLTLYTCTGFLDKERFIVVAKLRLG